MFPNLKSKTIFLFSYAFVNVKSFSFSLSRKIKLVLTAQVPLEHCYKKITFTFCLKSLYRVKNVFHMKLVWILQPRISSSFSSLKLRLETRSCGSKRNCWHLHGSNPHSTSLRCRLHLRHSVLNLNKRTYHLCSCGAKETEEHLLLYSSLRTQRCLLQSVKSILLKEGLQESMSSAMCDQPRFLQLLLFGHPSIKLNSLQIYMMLRLNI